MGLGNEEVCELFVELDEDGEFCEQPGDVSTPNLDRRLQEEHIHLGRGQIAELCLEITPFLQEPGTGSKPRLYYFCRLW